MANNPKSLITLDTNHTTMLGVRDLAGMEY